MENDAIDRVKDRVARMQGMYKEIYDSTDLLHYAHCISILEAVLQIIEEETKPKKTELYAIYEMYTKEIMFVHKDKRALDGILPLYKFLGGRSRDYVIGKLEDGGIK